MAGTKGRRRFVDAYLAEESIPFGSLKVFARTDRVRPFLKNGFALLSHVSIGVEPGPGRDGRAARRRDDGAGVTRAADLV